jgi:hypothetical protein
MATLFLRRLGFGPEAQVDKQSRADLFALDADLRSGMILVCCKDGIFAN